MSHIAKLGTILRLGLGNLGRVALYRLGLKTGRHPVLRITADVPEGPFFTAPALSGPLPSGPTRQDWTDGQGYFFGHTLPLVQPSGAASDAPPDWFIPHGGPTTQTGRANADRPWWTIPDFDPTVGDIKTVWEASRFDWALAFASRAAAGDTDEIDRLNSWITNWLTHNQPYLGTNWKCGQEASIRVMHLAAAALVLGQAQTPTPGLRALIHLHLKRIAPTMGYAIGQANNHGTSEAAALFIGGHWLGGADGRAWAAKGRRWLENRARVLIEPDGTFSQYSVTYHRVMLDTYTLVEVWRRSFDLPAFSPNLRTRLQAATHWLAQMTDPGTGDAPNIGANDGAHLIRLTPCGYRDFRPSVQLAGALFCNRRFYPTGDWDAQAQWLGIPLPTAEPNTSRPSHSFDNGGFHVLHAGPATAYLRYPRFRFRPGQADALHLDLWVDGHNILRDAGSFSYNVTAEDTAYFNGTAAHNTIQMDSRDQMPRLGRFLFGNWLRARDTVLVTQTANGVTAAAGYTDAQGAAHHRTAVLSAHHLHVTDRVDGFAQQATLRWRLAPGDWRITDQTITNGSITLAVTADIPLKKFVLSQGAESRYYLRKTSLPVLEITIETSGTLKTDIQF